MMIKDQRCDCNEIPDDLKLSGYFQRQTNLDTGKVPRYYYNTQAKVTFENSLSIQISDDEKSLLNQRIPDYTQVPPSIIKIKQTKIIKVLPPQNDKISPRE